MDRRGKRRQVLALVVLGALFVLLLAGLTLQRADDPSVPDGVVMIVEGAPSGIGTITERDFQQALTEQAAFGGLERPPKPSDERYEPLREAALGESLGYVWLRAEAEEMGIELSRRRVAAEVRRSNEDGTLTEAHFTAATMAERAETELLVTLIEDQLREQAPKPSAEELETYYEEERDTKYTSEERLDLRLVASEDPETVGIAKRALESDRSAASWERVAAKYSSDVSTMLLGGLRTGVREESLLPALRGPISEASVGELVGPIEVDGNHFAIEVSDRTRARTKPFDEVRAEIFATLASQKQQEFYAEWDGEFYGQWHARTYCADRFLIDQCANFDTFGHVSAPACLESDDEKSPEACPAVVPQAQPALPGSVTLVKPMGEPLPQRPFPEPLDEAGAEEPASPESLIEVAPARE